MTNFLKHDSPSNPEMLAKGNRKAGSSPEAQLWQEQAIFGSQLISQCWKLMHFRFWHSHSFFCIKTFLLCWACHYLTRVFRRALVKGGPQDCQIQTVAYSLPSKIAVDFEKLSSHIHHKSEPWIPEHAFALASARNGGRGCFFPSPLLSCSPRSAWRISSSAMAPTTPDALMAMKSGVTVTRMTTANIYWALTACQAPC